MSGHENQKLRNYAEEESRVVVLGAAKRKPETTHSLDYIAFEVVFETLYSEESYGRKMLDRMSNPA
jgi:hypothetical protein